MRLHRTVPGLAGVLLLTAAATACGKKGPPLAPLNLVPDRPARSEGRVVGDTVYLTIAVPSKNANGPGAVALDHLEIFAATVDAGALVPTNRELLTRTHTIATIPIKPPVDPDAPPDEEAAAADKRPAAGDTIVFAEPLTTTQTTPEFKTPAPVPAAAAAPASTATTAGQQTPAPTTAATGQPAAAPSTPPVVPPIPPDAVPATSAGTGVVSGLPLQLPQPPETQATGETPPEAAAASAAGQAAQPGTPASAATAKPAPTITRVYVIRGVTRGGRPGTPSARVVVPIVPAPPPPAGVTATFSESAVTISWQAPDEAAQRKPPLNYNVYPASDTPPPQGAGLTTRRAPLNDTPLTVTSLEHGGAEPGKEQCFVVRSVQVLGTVPIESAASDRACVTPVDRFPPKVPTGLAVVATAGAVNLIWDANSEADLAGYVVLRGEPGSDTLQPLTPEPIRETRFRDTTAQAGLRYAYAIVAVDRTGNRSAASPRVEETAR